MVEGNPISRNCKADGMPPRLMTNQDGGHKIVANLEASQVTTTSATTRALR